MSFGLKSGDSLRPAEEATPSALMTEAASRIDELHSDRSDSVGHDQFRRVHRGLGTRDGETHAALGRSSAWCGCHWRPEHVGDERPVELSRSHGWTRY